jgi:alpha-glucosidase (family GH31 glycosyl hydrolase)
MNQLYQMKTHPVCRPKSTVQGRNYRFTVLTSALLRLEYRKDGLFEDRATQSVINRDFPVPEFRATEKDGILEILTEKLRLKYNMDQPFAPSSLSIQVLGNLSAYLNIWHYGDPTETLGGTARTLDGADGVIQLEDGLVSRLGYSVVDDSRSMVLTEDGWVETRREGGIDSYFLGYGHDYLQCLRDFYHLCGKTPLLPRWALGNWWSRYHRYTEDEYKELFLRFEREKVPFTVSVIDMDWHLVDVDPKYGSGWTGYTWNTELFPDPPEFLSWLHRHKLKATLNVHPADGVRAYEKAYPAMAKEMGVHAENEEPVPFDPADSHFMESYFKYVHHPLEDEGVDFWWIDWQQGRVSRIPGLDPLWVLNHYHYLDSRRRGKRPVILSRFAGIGSHRYSIGFSGDSIVSWASLDFQPYFTATASNVGYGWWSHDIGGHMNGVRDDELATRWVQFGVFSPNSAPAQRCEPI